MARAERPLRFASLHGFASSPRSKKNLAFEASFAAAGHALSRPDLNQPSFGALSFRAMLGALDAMDEAGGRPRWAIVGSSLGGYVAALWAAAHPERVERLVLLCPAFDLAARWQALASPSELTQWERDGALSFADATGQSVPLHFDFVREARTIEPMPSPHCPTLVIHGRADVRVPIEGSRRFCARDPARRRIVEVEDGHELLADLPWLTRVVTTALVEGVVVDGVVERTGIERIEAAAANGGRERER